MLFFRFIYIWLHVQWLNNLEISETTRQTNYSQFNFPLNCVFGSRRYSKQLREYIKFGPPVDVNLQAGSLHNDINLHLTSAARSRQSSRLDVPIIDSQGVRLRAVLWMTLSRTGLIVPNNPRNFDTL